jgi:pimeloyl-ACP methyl ester carboxylesterase
MPAEPFAVHEDIDALLGHLGLDRSFLIGLSLGGSLALDFALERPAMVQGLVLVGATAHGFADWSPSLTAAWERVDEIIEAGDFPKAIEAELDIWTPANDPATDERVRSIARENLQQYDIPDGLMRWSDPPAFERLSEVRPPTMVIVGERDQPDTRRVGELMADAIPNARLEWLDADHMPNMRRPEEFNLLVLDFLRESAAQS